MLPSGAVYIYTNQRVSKWYLKKTKQVITIMLKSADPPGRARRAPLLHTYLPTYLPTYLTSFLFFFLSSEKKKTKRRFTSSLFSSLAPAGDALKLPGLLGTYFFRCQFSHRFLLIFWRPFAPPKLQKWIQKRAKIPLETYPKTKRKLSRKIIRKLSKYYNKAKCQNVKNHALVWARCTFSQSS